MRVFVCGISGRMGNAVCAEAIARGHEVVGGLDGRESVFTTFSSAESVDVDFDVLIDFSSPSLFPEVAKLVARTRRPAVVCTTALGDEKLRTLKAAAEFSPIFYSENVSRGVTVAAALSESAAKSLGEEFDVELVEAHHRKKSDSPSGTANLLVNAIKRARPDLVPAFLRSSARKPNEIGVFSVRGGTIYGEHEVIFAGDDEILTIKHCALGRSVFARGALNAASFLLSKERGFYTSRDLI